MDDLKLMTWNCRGVSTAAAYLSDCLQQYDIDICALTEHHLQHHNMFLLSQMYPTYTSYVTCFGDDV